MAAKEVDHMGKPAQILLVPKGAEFFQADRLHGEKLLRRPLRPGSSCNVTQGSQLLQFLLCQLHLRLLLLLKELQVAVVVLADFVVELGGDFRLLGKAVAQFARIFF